MNEGASGVNGQPTGPADRRQELVSRIRFLADAFGEAPTVDHLETAFGVTCTTLFNWAGYRPGENRPTKVLAECYREAGVNPPSRGHRSQGRQKQ